MFMRLFIGFVVSAGITVSVNAERPNIVLILADDLGYEAVGCYGGLSYPTPNIDQLAAEGIRFDQAYAMPLCTNTRIQFMTGKYNNRNWDSFGILNPNETTFGHLMRKAGYKTCIAGKWQLYCYDPPDFPGAQLRRETGMKAQDAGFDEYSLWHTGHTEEKGSRYADPLINENGEFLEDTKGKYGPDIWVDFIGDFMTRHRDEPFFVYYPMALPHNPMVPTPDSPEWADPEQRQVEETRFAADMIRYTDKVVGRIVDKIDQLGIRKKTLILFYSDNGTNIRVKSRIKHRTLQGGKGTATDLGIRVPAIANWPGTTPAGQVSQGLVDSVDFLPTLLDVAGASELIPEGIDGVSITPAIRGTGPLQRESVYIHHDPRPGWDKDRYYLMRLALDARYKLWEDGRLYDRVQDPFENVAVSPDRDTPDLRAARIRLQEVLDSMKGYRMFDPAVMPRPDPADAYREHEFHGPVGRVIAEPEMIPLPRDESWLLENALPGYTGTGYLRALRDQRTVPEKGVATIRVDIASTGEREVAVRARRDHVKSGRENRFWIKVNDGPWMIGMCGAEPGRWGWVSSFRVQATREISPKTYPMEEGSNTITIAPFSQNLKIDRVVAYESIYKASAMNPRSPVSSFNPY